MELEKDGESITLLNKLHKQLNTDQLLTLILIEEYGWKLKSVNHSSDKLPTHIVYNEETGEHAELDVSGEINIDIDIESK